MTNPMKLLNNTYKLLLVEKDTLYIEVLQGSFTGCQVKIYDIRFDERDYDDEKNVPVLCFEYTCTYSDIGHIEDGTEELNKMLSDIMTEILNNSVEYAKEVIGNDSVSDETE